MVYGIRDPVISVRQKNQQQQKTSGMTGNRLQLLTRRHAKRTGKITPGAFYRV